MADLHIGYEASLEEEGVHLPRTQTATMKESLIRVLEKHDPATVVVLGDLKHSFGRNLGQEWRDVSSILSLLSDRSKVVIVRGNHDNYLQSIASKLGLSVVERWQMRGLTFTHGHVACHFRPIVIAHEHPSVRIVDAIGASVKLPCFLHFRKDGVVVMPAFSPLALGTDVTKASSSDFLSPVLSGCDVNETSVYACSEIGMLSLGSVSSLGPLRD